MTSPSHPRAIYSIARAGTIPSPMTLGERFRGSTPHRYAARHRTTGRRGRIGPQHRRSSLPRAGIPVAVTSIELLSSMPLTATVTATAPHTSARGRTQWSLDYSWSPPRQQQLIEARH